MFEFAKDNVKFQAKMRSDDRVLVLRRKEGGAASTLGVVDNRLFKDENKLHIVRDLQYGFWTFKYEKGFVPAPLQQRFVNYSDAYNTAITYFNSRNVNVIDSYDYYD